MTVSTPMCGRRADGMEFVVVASLERTWRTIRNLEVTIRLFKGYLHTKLINSDDNAEMIAGVAAT